MQAKPPHPRRVFMQQRLASPAGASSGPTFPHPCRSVSYDTLRQGCGKVGQQILDILEAQAVSVIQPDGVADAVRRNALPKVAGSSNVQPGIVPRGA